MKTLLWLDDVRNPFEDNWVKDYSPIEPDEIIWVKNYNEFVEWIQSNGLPTAICFDHDLSHDHYAPEEFWDDKYEEWLALQNSTEKTGYDAAQYVVDYCMDRKLDIPLYGVQSANPVGALKIGGLFINYIKFHLLYGND